MILFRRGVPSRSTVIVGIVYALVAIGCTRIPLLQSLGYESSLLFALLGSIAAAMLVVNRIQRVYREPALEHALAAAGAARSLRASLVTNVVLLCIPLSILAGNAYYVRNCSLTEGLLFFLLLPGVSVIFSSAVAYFCVMHYRLPRLAVFLFMIATFCYAAAIGYYTPAIFSYNFFYGYFPGFTYDEGLRVTSTLISFRLITLASAAVFIWLGNLLLAGSDRSSSVVSKGVGLLRMLFQPAQRGTTALIAILAIALYVFRCDLGYESTSGYIRSWLGGELKTEHCVIYYPREMLHAEELARLADEHEFRYMQLLSLFSLPHFDRIESYIYPSADAKFRLIGAGNTDIAKPWSKEIHVTYQSAYATLKHEMTHVIAGKFGVPVIRASLRIGLTEGLPMAVEWSYGARTMHVYAAAMDQLKIAPDIERILSPTGFVTQAPSVSYVLAGSFTRYLIDTYGIRQYLLVYGGKDWKDVYGRSIPVLVQEWKNFLHTIDLEGADLAATRAFFSRTSIFQKTCPRVVGERNTKAVLALSNRQYALAESLYTTSYNEGGDFESLSGIATAALRRGAYRSVDSLLNYAAGNGGYADRFLLLSLIHGDALWGMDSTEEAFQYYHMLRMVDLTDGLTEAASERLLALDEKMDKESYRRYFLTVGQDTLRVRILDSLLLINPVSPLLHYLHARELLRHGAFDQVVQEMDSISMADQDPVLEALRLNTLGLASYFSGRYKKARAWFWQSLNFDESDVAEFTVDEWIDRCEWKLRQMEERK